jgi:hypothetical protein
MSWRFELAACSSPHFSPGYADIFLTGGLHAAIHDFHAHMRYVPASSFVNLQHHLPNIP